MKIRLKSLFVLLTSLSLSTLAAEPGKLPLDDQLKLVRNVEFNDASETSEPLIIEVGFLSVEICLKSLTQNIKDGYNPDYAGEFDNPFLNRLMAGVEKLDPYFGQNNHAHRKIEFRTVTGSGRESTITCDVRLSTNHKYVGINFWQQFIGYELIQPRFFLLDHEGNLLWEPPTDELQDKNEVSEINPDLPGIPWYPGSRVDRKPVEYFTISDDGHLFVTHGYFLPGRNPSAKALYDQSGGLLRDFGVAPVEFAFFSEDGLRLITKTNTGPSDVLSVIRSSDGKMLWESDPETNPSTLSSVSISSDGKSIMFCQSPKQSSSGNSYVLLEEAEDSYAERIIPFETSSTGQEPELLKEFKKAYNGLSDPIACDARQRYHFCVGNSFKSDPKSGQTEGHRLLLVLDSALNPVAQATIQRALSGKDINTRYLKKARIILDEKIGKIYLITKTEFAEFQFPSLAGKGGN